MNSEIIKKLAVVITVVGIFAGIFICLLEYPVILAVSVWGGSILIGISLLIMSSILYNLEQINKKMSSYTLPSKGAFIAHNQSTESSTIANDNSNELWLCDCGEYNEIERKLCKTCGKSIDDQSENTM